MRPHQAKPVPLQLPDDLFGGLLALGLEVGQQADELVVAAARHRQDEFQRLAVAHLRGTQGLEVVQAEQAAVGHQHHALERGEARQHLLHGRQQRGGLGGVAVEHFVVQRNAFGGLHHTQHELAGDDAFLGHAELAHVGVLGGAPFGTDGGQVVEHHRQVLVHQRIHAAQQLLVGDGLHLEIRKCHCLKPAQHAELGVRIAQAVEHHDAHQGLDVGRHARTPEHATKFREAELTPQLGECPNVAESARGFEARLRLIHWSGTRGLAGDAQQAIDNGAEFAANVFQAAQSCHRALAHVPAFVAERLDELDVPAKAGRSDLDEHAPTI